MKIHSRMAGKTVHSVWKCDNLLEVRFTDGTSLKIGWRNEDGDLVRGQPDVLFEGTHIRAQPVIIRSPQIEQPTTRQGG